MKKLSYSTRDKIESFIFGTVIVYLIAFVEASVTNLILALLIGYLFDKVTKLKIRVDNIDSKCEKDNVCKY